MNILILVLLVLARSEVKLVRESFFSATPDQVEWCGKEDSVLLAVTTTGSLFLTENKGALWFELTDKLKHAAEEQSVSGIKVLQ